MSEVEGDAVVLEAAGHLFREKGFEGTTVREIAAAAGMLPGSLHYRYATKEAILAGLMKRGMRRALREVREAIAKEREPIARLRAALRAHLRLLVEGDDAVYVILYEWRSLPPEQHRQVVRLRDDYEALWSGLLLAAEGAGHLRDGLDHRLLRFLLLGAMNWAPQWFDRRGELTAEEIADTFWSFVADGVLRTDSRGTETGS